MLSIEDKKEILDLINDGRKVYIENNTDFELPKYSHVLDAGMDLRSNEEVTIYPGETKVIKTGIKVSIPDGFEIQIRPRSGISLKTPLRVANAPGTIDAGYKDEIGVILTNSSLKGNEEKFLDEKGEGIYKIKKGDRIAQMVLCKFYKIDFEEVSDITTTGENRGGGFGHTGIK